MKTKTINLKADCVDFMRNWHSNGNNLTAEILGHTSKGTDMKVKLELDFDCLPYILPGLNTAWQKERAGRMAAIESVDKALGL